MPMFNRHYQCRRNKDTPHDNKVVLLRALVGYCGPTAHKYADQKVTGLNLSLQTQAKYCSAAGYTVCPQFYFVTTRLYC